MSTSTCILTSLSPIAEYEYKQNLLAFAEIEKICRNGTKTENFVLLSVLRFFVYEREKMNILHLAIVPNFATLTFLFYSLSVYMKRCVVWPLVAACVNVCKHV